MVGSEVVGSASKKASSSKRASSSIKQTNFTSEPPPSSLNKRLELMHTSVVRKPSPIPPKKSSKLYLFF